MRYTYFSEPVGQIGNLLDNVYSKRFHPAVPVPLQVNFKGP